VSSVNYCSCEQGNKMYQKGTIIWLPCTYSCF